jgi:Thrombospondin type 1 domain
MCLIGIANTSSLSKSLSNSNNSNTNANKQVNLNIPEGAKIFWQGWGRYYYANKNLQTAKEFFQNNAFFSQRYPVKMQKEKDSHGSLLIPDKSSFFIVVFKDNIGVYSARDEIIRHEVDSLLFENVLPVPEDDFMKGSIKNLGKFKAGHCLKIGVKTPVAFNAENLSYSSWIFCFDTNNIKLKFLKAIVKMKIIDQRSRDQIITASSVEPEPSANGAGAAEEKKPANLDGKMVLLQDWSDCTLKCGGGKSVQQWMCIPPQKGGKPCEGDTIRERPCNTDPCPVVTSADGKEEPKEKFVKPIVKITRYSRRFNRYTKCIIKETDIFRMDAQNNKYPARLVMNNKTLTIYQDDEYINKDYTFDLQHTIFTLLPEFCCFQLTDKQRSNKYCGFDAGCGDPDLNLFAKGMQQDFNDFKTVCNVGRQTHILTDEDEAKIKQAKLKATATRNFEVEAEKVEKVNDEIEQDTDNKVFKKITETQQTGLKALEKEIVIESLIKKDEEKREAEKENKIVDQMEEEKRKRRNINKQIQEKELEQEFVMDQMAAEKDIKCSNRSQQRQP